MDIHAAILEVARLRLRPILMTTLTTVTCMLPLAIGLSEGSEMLRPLAVTIVWGLSFSILVSLLLVPVLYELTHRKACKQVVLQGQPDTFYLNQELVLDSGPFKRLSDEKPWVDPGRAAAYWYIRKKCALIGMALSKGSLP